MAETVPEQHNDDQINLGDDNVDVGGGTTDVALVRSGSVEGTRMFALGGRAFTKSLAKELGPAGIRVNAVAPGWVLTDMTSEYLAGESGDAIRAQSPLGRTASTEEVAEVVLLVVSGRADAMTGGIIDVNCASYLRS